MFIHKQETGSIYSIVPQNDMEKFFIECLFTSYHDEKLPNKIENSIENPNTKKHTIEITTSQRNKKINSKKQKSADSDHSVAIKSIDEDVTGNNHRTYTSNEFLVLSTDNSFPIIPIDPVISNTFPVHNIEDLSVASPVTIVEKQNVPLNVPVEHEKGNFDCPVCRKSYKKKNSRKRHITRKHGPKNYKCPCGKGYAMKSEYNIHVQRKHVKRCDWPDEFICDICKQKYACAVSLKEHRPKCEMKLNQPSAVDLYLYDII